MTDPDTRELAERYVAVWNEPDADHRRAAVRALWAPDAVHLLQPPEEMRRNAHLLGFDRLVLEARGHRALDFRVTRAHEEFVAPGTYVFRPRGDADRIDNLVKFTWEMVARDDGRIAGAGLEILVLGPDGRIVRDHQFIEG